MTRGGTYYEIYPEPEGNPKGKACGISWGLGLYFIEFPDLSHNTDILNYISSIALPGSSIWEELNLCIAPTAGPYGKILASRLSNTVEVNFNIKMFSNWDCIRFTRQEEGYTVKYTPPPEGVPEGKARGNSWKRRGIFDRTSRVKS